MKLLSSGGDRWTHQVQQQQQQQNSTNSLNFNIALAYHQVHDASSPRYTAHHGMHLGKQYTYLVPILSPNEKGLACIGTTNRQKHVSSVINIICSESALTSTTSSSSYTKIYTNPNTNTFWLWHSRPACNDKVHRILGAFWGAGRPPLHC